MKPRLRFSRWIPWESRSKYSERRDPGAYLLAITKKNLSGTMPSWHDVVYIGMTNSQGGLLSRWNQFNASIHGRSGHSGGWTVFEDLGNYKNWKKKYHLFVAALPVSTNVLKEGRTTSDLIKMGWVAFLEYEALAKRKSIVGREPKYNKH